LAHGAILLIICPAGPSETDLTSVLLPRNLGLQVRHRAACAPARRKTIVGRALAQFCAVRAPVSASARFVPSSARRFQVPTRERAAAAVSPHISRPSRFVVRPVRADLMLAFLRAPSQPGRAGEHRGPARTGGAESPLFLRQRFTSHFGAVSRPAR
jgi:hypothetical protein